MLTIKNFREQLDSRIFMKGISYFNGGRVKKALWNEELHAFKANVKGSYTYEVCMVFDDKGTLIGANCDCPYWAENATPCKHMAAALIRLDKMLEEENKTESSGNVSSLIDVCRSEAEAVSEPSDLTGKIHLTPVLHPGSSLRFSLKIGMDRLYKVKSITKLYNSFLRCEWVRYGKGLEFVHDFSFLDDRSRRLLEIAVQCNAVENYYYRSDDSAVLPSAYFEEFFGLFRDEKVETEDGECLITFDDPRIKFDISRTRSGRYKITCDKKFSLLGQDMHRAFYSRDKAKLYVASAAFSRSAAALYRECCGRDVFVSEKDMPVFYTAVLKPALSFAEIKGMELIDTFIPPELSAQLYIDCDDSNVICGKLLFAYGDNIYTAFTGDTPGFDPAGERAAMNAVSRYFDVSADNSHHPLTAASDEKIYDLIGEGINSLSAVMEIYASERFRRIVIRPPVKPAVSVGLRPGGGLLDIAIDDKNYSPEELTAVLKAYRTGAKYHRLSDGSFVKMEETLSELSEIMDNLDISPKDMAKGKIKLPQYRMLYLDSLANGKNIRLRESAELKKTVKEYHEKMQGYDAAPVPQSLKGVMRDYQEQGFRWLETLYGYGFGGILADDMGLGKTIQAIALMQSVKENLSEHKINLIVCPSSLCLNWQSEIRRFAPSLKVLTVMGTAAVRSGLIEEISGGGYDAVITSYPLLARDIDKYEDIKFHIQFIDEAQYIKNHATQNAKAVKGICSEHRFALTGTPVENSLAELWSIFDFVMPGYLFGYTRFRKNFETPIVSKGDSRAESALRKNVSPFILRRMKKDVLEELPEKTETTLRSSMEGGQRKLYTANAASLKKSVAEGLGDAPADKIQILAMLTRLRQICCDPGLVYENYKGGSAKLEQCMELIESCVEAGHKLLLFSQFTSMLDIIKERLSRSEIPCYILTGATKARDRIDMVNRFNVNEVPVFLISLKAGGTGLNLTGADIVIHYDPWWNMSAQEQASDRVYRIGQKNNVQVYKLIAGDTIEENILRLQEEKAKLGDIVSGGGDIAHMTAEEIVRLIGG